MKVEDVFKKLSLGVLSNLAISNDGNGTIRDDAQNKIIGYMNDALLLIYTRFCFRQKEVMIRQYRHITNYHLDKNYAMQNDERPEGNYPYILDLPNEPFLDDAISVLSVHTEFGTELPVNDPSKPDSVFTPFPTQIQISDPVEGRPLSVVYQAKHVLLEYGVTNSVITLPTALSAVFHNLIAYYVYSDMNTETSMAKSQEQYAFYDAVCSKLEEKNLANSETIDNSRKFYDRGFV